MSFPQEAERAGRLIEGILPGLKSGNPVDQASALLAIREIVQRALAPLGPEIEFCKDSRAIETYIKANLV